MISETHMAKSFVYERDGLGMISSTFRVIFGQLMEHFSTVGLCSRSLISSSALLEAVAVRAIIRIEGKFSFNSLRF